MKARKSLGQHFLTSTAVVHTMIEAADLKNSDTILEIGPGKGVLTKALLEKAGHVIAIEKDKKLFEYLQEKFDTEIKNKKLTLVHDDILIFNFSFYNLKPKTYKLISNIPYYITGEILKKFLSSHIQPHTIVLLIQKEVAQRIAKEKKESILSLSIKAYGTPHYIKTVSARYFKPKPKVDSAILSIENISKDFFKSISEKDFFVLVKTGFQHKRKLLIKNIKPLFKNQSIEKKFDDCSVHHKARAETLSIEQWGCLCTLMRTDK